VTPQDYFVAARVPLSLKPQVFGLWTIHRVFAQNELHRRMIGSQHQTLLYRVSLGTMLEEFGDLVMEDSESELRKHLPIWLAARGRVLVTGLGLGCVVRGLLASPSVTHVDVVEIDRQLLRVVGHEFLGNSRVRLHEGDALTFSTGSERWDYIWHDLWHEEGNVVLQEMHAQLLCRFQKRCQRQGAWAFPRILKRLIPEYLG
jgi:hypothetical protein